MGHERCVLSCVSAFVLAAPPATAPGRFEPWHLDVGVQTSVPADVAGRIDVEMPARLQFTTSLGVLPGPYVDVINGVAVAAGGYDDDTASLIRSSLQRSMVWRTRLGWRPLKKRGFTFGVGYGLLALGGEARGSEVVSALTGAEPPEARPGSGSTDYDIDPVVHAIDVEIGWRFLFLRDRLVLRTAIGYLGTLASSTTLQPGFEPARPGVEAGFRAASEAELDDLIESYFHAPLVTVSLGWRAF